MSISVAASFTFSSVAFSIVTLLCNYASSCLLLWLCTSARPFACAPVFSSSLASRPHFNGSTWWLCRAHAPLLPLPALLLVHAMTKLLSSSLLSLTLSVAASIASFACPCLLCLFPSDSTEPHAASPSIYFAATEEETP